MSAIFILEDTPNLGPKFYFRYQLKGESRFKEVPDFNNVHFSLARKYEDAIEIVSSSAPFDIWTLDWDLHDRNGTGLDFLKFIAMEHPHKWPKLVLVHSNHSDAKASMYKFINEFESKRNQK